MTAQKQNFEVYAGNDSAPVITVEDDSGNVVDISTATSITWEAKRSEASTSTVLEKSKVAGTIAFLNDGTDGKFVIDITAADTQDLVGLYYHSADIVLNEDKTTTTVGVMTVLAVGTLTTDNSYATVEEADDYHGQRNNSAWMESDPVDREAWLLDAMDYMEAKYRWKGAKTDPAQALEWPRTGARDRDSNPIDSATTPDDVKATQIILADYSRSNGPLLGVQARGGGTQSTRVKVDVIEEEFDYFESAPKTQTYPLADGMIDYLLSGASSSLFKNVVRV